MKDRLRRKIWKEHWFFLELSGFDFHSFNSSNYRSILNSQIKWDYFSNMSVHVR